MEEHVLAAFDRFVATVGPHLERATQQLPGLGAQRYGQVDPRRMAAMEAARIVLDLGGGHAQDGQVDPAIVERTGIAHWSPSQYEGFTRRTPHLLTIILAARDRFADGQTAAVEYVATARELAAAVVGDVGAGHFQAVLDEAMAG